MVNTNGIIYLFTNRLNGKQYVGQTIHEKARYRQHILNSGNAKYGIDADLEKLGISSFDYKVLVRVVGNAQDVSKRLDELETYYINKNHTRYPSGYNFTSGGEKNDYWLGKKRNCPKFNNRGRVFINNGTMNKCIFPEQIDEYITKGWKKGRISSQTPWNKGLIGVQKHSDETRRKMSVSRIGNHNTKGKIWVSKDDAYKMIAKEELDSYISRGWTKGRRGFNAHINMTN